MKDMIGYCGLDCEKCDAYLACEHMCEIRKCALEKGVSTCGDCSEIETCPTVGGILKNNLSALENLKG